MYYELMTKLRNFLHNFYYCTKEAFEDTINHDGVEHAGYLSFLTILSIFPFLVFFISLAGIFGGTALGEELVIILFENMPGEAADAIKPRIDEIMTGPPQSLLTIAIVGAIWTASSTVEGLRTIFNRAYRVSTPPSYVWRRLMSIVQFLCITILILSSMFIIIITPLLLESVLSLLRIEHIYDYSYDVLKLRFIFSSIIIFCAVSFIYYVIPNVKQGLVNVCPGALMVVILWSVTGSFFSLYLSNFDQVNLIYGSLASFIIALIFFYIIAMILIFGAEFNHSIERLTGFKFVEKIHAKHKKKQ